MGITKLWDAIASHNLGSSMVTLKDPMDLAMELAEAMREFNLAGDSQILPGGSTTNYRIGDIVLKRIRETSLENNHSPELAA